MAGDWIKMRGNLWDDPRVSRLCDLTDEREAAVIGALYWLWAAADQHSEDGAMPGLTVKGIDRKTGVPGLGRALVEIGWIFESEDGISIIRFDEHNGASAKRRVMEAKRKANSRKGSTRNPQGGGNVSASHAGTSGTGCGSDAELEKEIEKEIDNNTPPSIPPPAGGESEPRRSRASKATPKTKLARDAELTADQALRANLYWLDRGRSDLDAADEFERFKAHHISKGSVMADWDHAWTTWYTNALRFSSRAPPPPSPPDDDFVSRHTDRAWSEGIS